MIKLILIILALHYIGFLYKRKRGYKSNTLSCGIFGFAGKNAKDFSKDKLNMLGLANETRGKHSCGVAVDGDIQIGIDNMKLFTDFAIENRYDSPVTIPIVIGHTRQATWGKHTLENAHPFGFGNLNEGFEFSGCHNGTLVNHEELAKKYNVSLTAPFIEKGKKEVLRDKIDSELLLEIIYKTKNIDVLSEYVGAAALVWTDLNKPNVVYCYHGKSLLNSYGKEAIEERPLFYYQESKNSMYFSSIKDSLKMIAHGSDQIFSFDYNIVYEITDGDVSKAKRYVVKREKMYQKGYTVNKQYTNYMNNYSSYQYAKVSKKKRNRRNNNSYIGNSNDINIFFETPRFKPSEIGGRPYFNKLAWWRNGHRLTGVFIRIENYGLYDLNLKSGDKESSLKEKINIELNYLIYREFDMATGMFSKCISNDNILFKDVDDIPLVYIYNGIMVKTLKDFEVVVDFHNTKYQFDWSQLSHCSVHPITSSTALLPNKQQGIIKDGEIFKGKFSMYGLYRIYSINNGNLTEIKDIPTSGDFYYKPKSKNIEVLPSVIDINEGACVNNIRTLFNEVEEPKVIQIEPDIIVDTIDQIFEKPIMQLMLGRAQLKKWKNDKLAKYAIDTIDVIIEYAKELT